MKHTTSETRLFGLKFPAPENWMIWVTIALIVKTAFFLFKIFEAGIANLHYTGIFGVESGDTLSYIEPVDNLLVNGTYHDDHRMPGYGWLYFVFRLFLSQTCALNSILIVQL